MGYVKITLGLILASLIALFLWDIFQRKHNILRNYPIAGHLRYFFEWLGVSLRLDFYARDREELPFNRTQRSWVYEAKYHLDLGCDLVAEIGSAKYGFRDEKGNLSDEKLKEFSAYPQVKMFEIKLSQGAKPGKGGLLPAIKVTPEIAKIRSIPAYQDSISPNRFPEIGNASELLD